MPQFDLANFVPQLVWLTIFFAILYFGIVRLTLPKLARTVSAREDKVTGDIALAETAKAESDAMAAAYAAGIEEAQNSARGTVDSAKATAAASIETALKAGNAEIAEKAEAANTALSAARDKAMGEIEAATTEAVVDIVERLTGKRPDAVLASNAAKTALAA